MGGTYRKMYRGLGGDLLRKVLLLGQGSSVFESIIVQQRAYMAVPRRCGSWDWSSFPHEFGRGLKPKGLRREERPYSKPYNRKSAKSGPLLK